MILETSVFLVKLLSSGNVTFMYNLVSVGNRNSHYAPPPGTHLLVRYRTVCT
jgi:hypothetical protein